MKFDPKLVERVRQLRRELKMREIAELTGIPQGSLGRYLYAPRNYRKPVYVHRLPEDLLEVLTGCRRS